MFRNSGLEMFKVCLYLNFKYETLWYTTSYAINYMIFHLFIRTYTHTLFSPTWAQKSRTVFFPTSNKRTKNIGAGAAWPSECPPPLHVREVQTPSLSLPLPVSEAERPVAGCWVKHGKHVFWIPLGITTLGGIPPIYSIKLEICLIHFFRGQGELFLLQLDFCWENCTNCLLSTSFWWLWNLLLFQGSWW